LAIRAAFRGSAVCRCSIYQADLSDTLNEYLGQYQQRFNKHPLIIIDESAGLRDELWELLRLLANFDMDSEERISFILLDSQKLTAASTTPKMNPSNNVSASPTCSQELLLTIPLTIYALS